MADIKLLMHKLVGGVWVPLEGDDFNSGQVQDELDAHIENLNNPHQVTKVQVGLGNVPNVNATSPSNISQSSSYRFVTDSEKSLWNGKVDAAFVSSSIQALNLGNASTYTVGTSQGQLAALSTGGVFSYSVVPTDTPFYTNIAAFPAIGAANRIYTALDTNKTYRWNGSAYEQIGSPSNTDALTEGSSNKYFTEARVRSSLLTGIDFSDPSPIQETNNILFAMGKLQAQISANTKYIEVNNNADKLALGPISYRPLLVRIIAEGGRVEFYPGRNIGDPEPDFSDRAWSILVNSYELYVANFGSNTKTVNEIEIAGYASYIYIGWVRDGDVDCWDTTIDNVAFVNMYHFRDDGYLGASGYMAACGIAGAYGTYGITVFAENAESRPVRTDQFFAKAPAEPRGVLYVSLDDDSTGQYVD